VLYNVSTACFGHFTWPSSGLYLAYEVTALHTSVSNGRRDLVNNGQIHEPNRMVPLFAILILCTVF